MMIMTMHNWTFLTQLIFAIGMVRAAVRVMPPTTDFKDFDFKKLVCDNGAELTRVEAKAAISDKYLSRRWANDWVWIDQAKGDGAHRIDAAGAATTDQPITFLFSFDPSAGPRFSYRAGSSETGEVFPHQYRVWKTLLGPPIDADSLRHLASHRTRPLLDYQSPTLQGNGYSK